MWLSTQVIIPLKLLNNTSREERVFNIHCGIPRNKSNRMVDLWAASARRACIRNSRITLLDIRASGLPDDDARHFPTLRRTCMYADNRFVKSSGKGNVKVNAVPHLVIERNFLRREPNLRRAEMTTTKGELYKT